MPLTEEQKKYYLKQSLIYEGNNLVVLKAQLWNQEGDSAIWELVEHKMKDNFKLINIPKDKEVPYIILWKEDS